MRVLVLGLLFLQSCAVADAVIENTAVYCSKPYVLARSATRSVVALTAGINLPDTCESLGVNDGGATEEES